MSRGALQKLHRRSRYEKQTKLVFCTQSKKGSENRSSHFEPKISWIFFSRGSGPPLKPYVSFAKEPYKRDFILQKRPISLRSLLIVARIYHEFACYMFDIVHLLAFPCLISWICVLFYVWNRRFACFSLFEIVDLLAFLCLISWICLLFYVWYLGFACFSMLIYLFFPLLRDLSGLYKWVVFARRVREPSLVFPLCVLMSLLSISKDCSLCMDLFDIQKIMVLLFFSLLIKWVICICTYIHIYMHVKRIHIYICHKCILMCT